MSSVLWLHKLLIRQKWITTRIQGKVCINYWHTPRLQEKGVHELLAYSQASRERCAWIIGILPGFKGKVCMNYWHTPRLQGKGVHELLAYSQHTAVWFIRSAVFYVEEWLHNSPYLGSLVEKSVPDLEEDVTDQAVHKHNQEPVEGDERGVHLIMLKMSMKPG